MALAMVDEFTARASGSGDKAFETPADFQRGLVLSDDVLITRVSTTTCSDGP